MIPPTPPANAAPPQKGIVATGRNGNRYEGDLLADMAEYRRLRTARLTGQLQDEARFEELEKLMRQPPGATDDSALRMFYRYDCDFEASVQMGHGGSGGERLPVRVRDISAGGVKLACDRTYEDGEAVELVLLPKTTGGDRVVTMPSRVAWKKPGFVGLMFAGAPRYEEA